MNEPYTFLVYLLQDGYIEADMDPETDIDFDIGIDTGSQPPARAASAPWQGQLVSRSRPFADADSEPEAAEELSMELCEGFAGLCELLSWAS